MNNRSTGAVLVALACLIPAADVGAQTRNQRAPARVEIAAGSFWTGPTSFGVSDATETSSNGGQFRLFSTSSRLASTFGGSARVAVRVHRLFEVGAVASYGLAEVRTGISDDSEGGQSLTATERLTQFIVGGEVLVPLTRWHVGSRGTPFVAGGVGYLRQLHSGRTLAQSGRAYHVGGGVNYLLHTPVAGFVKGVGVRAEARAIVRSDGVAFDRRAHVAPEVSASIFCRF